MPNYWIWPMNRQNFEILRAQGYKFMDFKKLSSSVERVALGDGIAVYISKRYGGDAHIKAILKARSTVYKRGSPAVPVWSEEQRSGRIEWPFRVDATPIRECNLDLRSIFPTMEAPSQKEKSRPGGLGLFLQGATLKSITSNDWGLIESALEDAVVPPLPPLPPPPPPHIKTKARVFGPPLNFRELRHEPINESGVIYLFGMVARELGFLVESVATGYPDCDAKRRNPRGLYEAIRIEFEFRARNFQIHGHDPADCNLIVCWEDDWPDCPVEVLELKSAIQRLDPDVGRQ